MLLKFFAPDERYQKMDVLVEETAPERTDVLWVKPATAEICEFIDQEWQVVGQCEIENMEDHTRAPRSGRFSKTFH